MLRGVFGGSFDPVHIGHLTVARAARDRLGLDVVHLIPANRQPFKAQGHVASARDRLAMLRVAVAESPGLRADAREVERGGVSYTIDSLRELRAEFSEDALCLLIGADAARELPGWREGPEISRLARIGVLTRPGTPMPDLPWAAELVEVPAVAVSATDVRARLRRGESVTGLIPDAVAEYITTHGLYRTED
ncbi:MAG: nicotinate-nucleotide adenylyltransferase [Gemmatimonadota bacterium]|nr:nicotinate-nucleotide adenylyltransferase [Gemmatimonadota bacterium]